MDFKKVSYILLVLYLYNTIHHIYRIKEKNHIDIVVDAKKITKNKLLKQNIFDKICYPLIIKILSNLKIECPQPNKSHLQ